MIYNTTTYGGRSVCVGVGVCVSLVHVCVFGKLRIFLCRTSHYFFPELRNTAHAPAHLLGATEGPSEKPNEAVCSANTLHPLRRFSTVHRLLTVYTLILSAPETDSTSE